VLALAGSLRHGIGMGCGVTCADAEEYVGPGGELPHQRDRFAKIKYGGWIQERISSLWRRKEQDSL